MKVAIMQPYFFPYLGYFQLASMVDAFVIYDNIKYTKKGWINRNRIMLNGREQMISIPLKKSSDFHHIVEKEIADEFQAVKRKIINQLGSAYRRSPGFTDGIALVQEIFSFNGTNLFDFLHHSLNSLFGYLDIGTPLKVSSHIEADHELSAEERIIDICRVLGAKTYINPIGGLDMYSKERFAKAGIDLQFHNMKVVPYAQNSGTFTSHLSIIDVLMQNQREAIPNLLSQYEIIRKSGHESIIY